VNRKMQKHVHRNDWNSNSRRKSNYGEPRETDWRLSRVISKSRGRRTYGDVTCYLKELNTKHPASSLPWPRQARENREQRETESRKTRVYGRGNMSALAGDEVDYAEGEKECSGRCTERKRDNGKLTARFIEGKPP